MNDKKFVKGVIDTESNNFDSYLLRQNTKTMRLLHASMGLHTESGEFADSLKRHIFYGEELDTKNLTEELGDLMYYISLAADEIGVTLGDVKRLNHKKLALRYGDTFSESKALQRNVADEAKVFDGAMDKTGER